jgi:hypothetical protein
MSFDLIAFDLSVAPPERYKFLGWIREQCSGCLSMDSRATGARLLAWQQDMTTEFAAVEPSLSRISAPAGDRAEYRFGVHLVQASFDWDRAGPALYRARRAALVAGVGLFDASGRERAVWAIGRRGRFEIVHSDISEPETA